MRAAVCRAFGEPLVIEDLRLDPVGPAEVRVEVAACAICHSDIHYADGSWGGELPAVYGHEAAGTVAEVGDRVSDVTVGDRVAISLIRSCGDCAQCQRGYEVFCEAGLGPPAARLRTADGEPVEAALRCGAFAEEATVHHSQVVPIPGDLDWPAAALLGCGVITGVGAVLNTSTVDETSTVAVIGAGGVGLNAVQAAALVGAPVVVAEAGRGPPSRRPRCRRCRPRSGGRPRCARPPRRSSSPWRRCLAARPADRSGRPHSRGRRHPACNPSS